MEGLAAAQLAIVERLLADPSPSMPQAAAAGGRAEPEVRLVPLEAAEEAYEEWEFEDEDEGTLWEACETGAVDEVRALLRRWPLERFCVVQGDFTPLLLAAMHGNTRVVKVLLLHLPAEQHSVVVNGSTALHYACFNGHSEIARVLIPKLNKSQLDARCMEGWTPLHYAMLKGHRRIGNLLLQAKANLNSMDSHLRTPLHHAAGGGHSDCIKLLLFYNADVNARDIHQATPLHYAVLKGSKMCASVLQEHQANRKAVTLEGESVLHMAVRSGSIECVEFFLSQGMISLDTRTKLGWTPLHTAARYGRSECIPQLLESQATVSEHSKYRRVNKPLLCTVDIHGHNPLHTAAQHGSWQFADELIKLGADVFAVEKLGRTALHVAAAAGSVECVATLIDWNAAVDDTDDMGLSPLMLALQNFHLECALLLIDNGASLSNRDALGRTALHWCAEYETSFGEFLVGEGDDLFARDADGNTPLHLAAKHGNVEMIQAMLEQCLVSKAGDEKAGKEEARRLVNAQNAGGQSALHTTAVHRQEACMEYLFQQGAEVSLCDKARQTPLHLASAVGALECVKLLLAQGSDVNASTALGNGPLHLASRNGHLKTARALLQAGAEVNAANKDRDTPLLVAALHGRSDVCKCLLSHSAAATPGKHGRRLLHCAAAGGRLMKFLLDASSSTWADCKDGRGRTPIVYAAEAGQLAACRELVKKGARAAVLDDHGWSPLHAAAAAGATAQGLFAALVENGCDVNAVTAATAPEEEAEDCPSGCSSAVAVPPPLSATPLHLAAYGGHAFVVEQLLRLKANAEAPDHLGRLAIHIAVAVGANDTVTRLLLCTADPRAQVTKKDSRGRTPLALAKANGDIAIVAEMAEYAD
mmetsp:Transcript_7816/g.32888  ORF Transcript_7816/g.32888 Transcript_7816/m.32888 type:complete len:872 (-) Transcript_7816:37-2652(-)